MVRLETTSKLGPDILWTYMPGGPKWGDDCRAKPYDRQGVERSRAITISELRRGVPLMVGGRDAKVKWAGMLGQKKQLSSGEEKGVDPGTRVVLLYTNIGLLYHLESVWPQSEPDVNVLMEPFIPTEEDLGALSSIHDMSQVAEVGDERYLVRTAGLMEGGNGAAQVVHLTRYNEVGRGPEHLVYIAPTPETGGGVAMPLQWWAPTKKIDLIREILFLQ